LRPKQEWKIAAIETNEIEISTKGEIEIQKITERAQGLLGDSRLNLSSSF